MASERTVIFCLVPLELEAELLAPLQRHFADHPEIQVIVDRRTLDRRARSVPEGPPLPRRGEEDRRSGTDRRRPVLPRLGLSLPPELAEHRAAVRFLQRLMPVSGSLESLPADEVVARVRAGDAEAPTELYWRCFERVHSRLSVVLGDAAKADAAVGAAFGRILDAIAREDPAASFDELLYAAVDEGVTPADEDGEVRAGLPDGPSLAVTDPLLDEPVSVRERDPRWFGRAQAERDAILRRVGEHIVAIEHIGGTAVPAIPGRPVIDLLVGVDAMPAPGPVHELLIERGYESCGDAGTPGRAYYRKRGLAHFDVHVVAYGDALWSEPVALREHLRRYPVEAQRGASARREAARARPWSAQAYAEQRASALGELLERAREAAGGRTATT